MSKITLQGPRRRRGLTLIEAALVLGVLALVIGGLAEAMSVASENQRSKASAERISEIARASQQYLAANQTALLGLLPNPNMTTVVGIAKTSATGNDPGGPNGLPSLQGGGYLPSTYVDLNSYSQSHALVVKSIANVGTTGEHLEGMVISTGGMNIPDRQVGRIARFMGAQGGFMMSAPLAGYNTAQIYGTGGGWVANASTWSYGGVIPKAGHVMQTVSIADNSVAGQYLNRNDIKVPEANTMRTDLHMGNMTIDNVQSVCSSSDTNGLMKGGSCSQNGSQLQIGPNIYVPGYVHADGEVNAGTNMNAGGQIHAGGMIYNDNGDIQSHNGSVTAKYDLHSYNGNIIADNGSVFAHVFYDQDQPYTWYADPSGTSNMNSIYAQNVNAQEFNLDTKVYGGSYGQAGGYGGIGYGSGIRLGDLLPRYVAEAAYYGETYVGGGGAGYISVPTPNCQNGGQPKIFATNVQDSMTFVPSINKVIQGNNTNIGTAYSWQTQDPVMSNTQLLSDVSGNSTNLGRRVTAQYYGGSWLVTVSGTPNYPNGNWQGLFMTYCDFPY